MLIPNHPDAERLSALASHDTDATADATLTAHVSTCVRCTGLVTELGALRASLAELPDLRPHRPLRLLPEVADEPSRVDRLGGWARRFFAPVLTAGAALAMVGLVGTAAPVVDGLASGQAAAPSAAMEDAGGAPAAGEPGAESLEGQHYPFQTDATTTYGGGDEDPTHTRDTAEDGRLAAEQIERSPWPMILFTGVALMVAAALLRWILVPRAG